MKSSARAPMRLMISRLNQTRRNEGLNQDGMEIIRSWTQSVRQDICPEISRGTNEIKSSVGKYIYGEVC